MTANLTQPARPSLSKATMTTNKWTTMTTNKWTTTTWIKLLIKQDMTCPLFKQHLKILLTLKIMGMVLSNIMTLNDWRSPCIILNKCYPFLIGEVFSSVDTCSIGIENWCSGNSMSTHWIFPMISGQIIRCTFTSQLNSKCLLINFLKLSMLYCDGCNKCCKFIEKVIQSIVD